ncbi:Myo2p [Aphelenchoides avenae]|nr:Myo2p [Aphelenchus avenae]
MPPSKLALLAKYIVQKGIDNVAQRDEIYVQLVNQTHKNGNPSNVQRVWNLMLNAINSFAPGILVFPMLYRYFEQQPAQLSKLLIQSLLRPLRHADAVRQRTTAPTLLEQIATERRQAPVVLVRCTDGNEFGVEVDAWSTAEEICARVLKQRGIGDSEGWGLMIENESTVLEVSDNQYLFDALSRFEIPSHNDGSFMSYKRMPLDDAGRPSRRPSKAEYDQWTTNGAEAQKRSTSVASPVRRSSGTNDKHSMGQVGQRFRYENGQIIPMAPEKPVELPKDYPDDRDRITMSIPSRIRNTQIPSRNGDVDRFLDEIFDQALPPFDDDMPPARIIAASIKGGVRRDRPTIEDQNVPQFGRQERPGHSFPTYATYHQDSDPETAGGRGMQPAQGFISPMSFYQQAGFNGSTQPVAMMMMSPAASSINLTTLDGRMSQMTAASTVQPIPVYLTAVMPQREVNGNLDQCVWTSRVKPGLQAVHLRVTHHLPTLRGRHRESLPENRVQCRQVAPPTAGNNKYMPRMMGLIDECFPTIRSNLKHINA